MAYSAFAVAGTQISIETGSPATFSPINGVEGFTGPTGTKQDIDVTAISDTAAKFVTGMPDFGTVSFTLFWDPSDTVHTALFTAYKTANSKNNFQITCSDAGAAVIAFEGMVNGWEHDFGKGNAATVKVSIKCTGLPTITP